MGSNRRLPTHMQGALCNTPPYHSAASAGLARLAGCHTVADQAETSASIAAGSITSDHKTKS